MGGLLADRKGRGDDEKTRCSSGRGPAEAKKETRERQNSSEQEGSDMDM